LPSLRRWRPLRELPRCLGEKRIVQVGSGLRLINQTMILKDHADELCKRAQDGDLAAASDLVASFYQSIFAYLRRLANNEVEAADLTQRTFTKAWQSLSSFQGRSSFSTWLHGIAYHVYLDWLRKRNPAEARSEEWWEACASDGPGPDEDAARHDLARQLYFWVDQLEEGKRQAVHLHYYQNLSLSETAEALGVAASTVKYRLREALDALHAKATKPNLASERRIA